MTMPRQSRESVQDAAIVQLLRALPSERLDGILQALDVPVAAREEAHRRIDPRRCLVCSNGYLRCRTVNEKAQEGDRHEWTPDRSRSDT